MNSDRWRFENGTRCFPGSPLFVHLLGSGRELHKSGRQEKNWLLLPVPLQNREGYFFINVQQIALFVSVPLSLCPFDGELARWAPVGIERLGRYFCLVLVLLCEAPTAGVTCALEIKHRKSNAGFHLIEYCSLCIL